MKSGIKNWISSVIFLQIKPRSLVLAQILLLPRSHTKLRPSPQPFGWISETLELSLINTRASDSHIESFTPHMLLSSKKHNESQIFCRKSRRSFMLSCHPGQVTVSLFTCLQHLLDWIQKVQNAAARLLARSSRMTHVTPILCSLHWLPIYFQGSVQSTWTTFGACHGWAPLSDLSDLLHHCAPVYIYISVVSCTADFVKNNVLWPRSVRIDQML